jgi:hypothetical protein
MIKKLVIYGCEESDEKDKVYLVRYTLFECQFFQICLHVFFRSDASDMHDHPWNFVSLILWNGYTEHVSNKGVVTVSRKYPGMILFRRAKHMHKVELINGRRAISLVLMGKRQRIWGFNTIAGWMDYIKYFKKNKC